MSKIVAKLRGTAILDELRQIADEAADEIDRLNAALRAARNEAMEEAAKIAEEEMVDYWIDDLDLTKNNACERVASNIRALKDKQP